VSSLSEKRKVTVNGVEYEVDIQYDNGKWEVSLEGNVFEVEIDQQPSRHQRKKRDTNRGITPSSGIISSAIPGKIVSVLVSEGDEVDSDSVVIVLEAMKMQNEIKAGIDGKIEKIMCKPGERIEANVPMMEILGNKKEVE
tara:strand:+ start:1747 stop:2166 length:420 start_codon:yes stop_codon:yes gene_type:complete